MRRHKADAPDIIVEEFRPRFTQRELTDAERDEIKSLTAPWKNVKALEAMLDSKYSSPILIPWSTLRRLSELGETGDKVAMRAVMEAFALVRDTNANARAGGLVFTGWDSASFANAQNGRIAYRVAEALANIWAAHYWQKHGEDRLAGRAFSNCTSLAYSCMGYKRTVTGSLYDWVWTGKGKNPHSVNNITFVPAAGTPAEREERFLGYLDGSFKGRVNENVYDEYFLATQAVYAEQTGRLALWDNVMLNRSVVYPNFTSQQELSMRETLKARADAIQWKKKFEDFMAKKNTTPYEQGHMQAELLNRSDADLFRYAEKYDIWFQQLEPRLCSGKLETSKACLATRARIEKSRLQYAADIEKTRLEMENNLKIELAKKAEKDEKYRQELAKRAADRKPPDFWEQLVGLAEGFAAAAAAGSEQVTVRKYDNAGNFLGTESMTRARAAGLGAHSK